MQLKSEYSDLRRIYLDILRGYTLIDSEEFGQVFVKHLTNFDLAQMEEMGRRFLHKAQQSGAPTYKERLDYLTENGFWSEEQENDIKNQESFIKNLYKTKSKLAIPSQIENIKKNIEESEKKIEELRNKKISLIGPTIEYYYDKKLNEFCVVKSFYKDEKLTDLLFSDYNELEETEIYKAVEIYNKQIKDFEDKNFKRISLSNFFTSFFYTCDNNPFIFFGKPIVELTFYQVQLFNYGIKFKSILTELQDKVSDDLLEDPDKLIEYYESTKNTSEMVQKHMQDNRPGASFVTGATKEDMKKMGLDQQGGIDLVAEAKKHGGKLNMKQLMKLHGEG